MLSFFRRAPLVAPCLFFIIGILFEFENNAFTIWYKATLAMCIVLFLILLSKRKNPNGQSLLLLVAFLFGGMFTVSQFIQSHNSAPKQSIQLKFHIEKKLRENQYLGIAENQKFLVETDNIDTLQPGDCLSSIGVLTEIQAPKLPWNFDKKKQMLSNGITHEFKIQSIQSTSIQDRNSPLFFPQQLQQKLQRKITTFIPDTASAAILSALLLGETSLLTKEISSDYSVAGVVHILAVSGMHVALIYELILFILKLFVRKRRKWLTFFLAMTLLWTYGAITGFSASVVRACCMFSFFVLSDCFLLSRNTANTIAGSTLLILYFQPFLIFNLGFLLSISAVLGIVIIHPLIMKKCYTENKFGYYLISSASITLSAQLSTLPLTLYIFHSFPTYFLLANLILVPWSTLILYIGIGFLFLSGIPLLGDIIVILLKNITAGMNYFIHLIQYLPRAQIVNLSFNFQQELLAYILLITSVLFVLSRRNFPLHISGFTLLLFISFSYATPSKTGLLFTYYQSNIMLFGTEKQIFIACNNDTLSTKYLQKLNNWKCQQNRANQEIQRIAFPSALTWVEGKDTTIIALLSAKKNTSVLLLNEEMKKHRVDSSLFDRFQYDRVLIGKGVSKKKNELLSAYLTSKNIIFQNIQSEPFNIK